MALASPPGPPFADVAFLGNDAIEQNEAHHAANVGEQHHQAKPKHHQNCDQAGKHQRVVAQQLGPGLTEKMLRSSLAMSGGGYVEITAESSSGTQFSREHSNQGQARPLAEAKRLQKLLLGVLKRGIYGVDSGNWQACTSALQIGPCKKYSEEKKRAMTGVRQS